ncbi:MAG: phosphodiesterase [Magnetococcales bacterium]|nr:phosphodiesterase [Magnetococcales bacterium]
MFRLAHLSDIHLLADPEALLYGQYPLHNFMQVLERVVTWEPDLLLVSGDISQESSMASYGHFARVTCSLPCPIRLIPGNHDRLDLFQEAFDGERIGWQRRVEMGGWRLICLDSTQPDESGGVLGVAELAALEDSLAASSPIPTLIALHHPPALIQSTWMDRIGLQNPHDLFQITKRHPEVKAVVFGHIHQAFDEAHDGLRLLGAPATSVQFVPRVEEMAVSKELPGFRWFHLHDDGRFETGCYQLEPA